MITEPHTRLLSQPYKTWKKEIPRARNTVPKHKPWIAVSYCDKKLYEKHDEAMKCNDAAPPRVRIARLQLALSFLLCNFILLFNIVCRYTTHTVGVVAAHLNAVHTHPHTTFTATACRVTANRSSERWECFPEAEIGSSTRVGKLWLRAFQRCREGARNERPVDRAEQNVETKKK